MATIEKRGANSYRISENYKGKRYRITIEAEKRPTMKEAIRIMDEVRKEQNAKSTDPNGLTIEAAAEKYISAKENSLSPSTIRGYKTYKKNLPEDFRSLAVNAITEEDLQKLVKAYQAEHTIKYTKNVINFVHAAIKMFRKDANFSVTYATEAKKEPYIPTDQEIKKILDAAKGTEFEIPLMLAALCGLRRGEILALKREDLEDNNILHINKAVVIDDSGEIITKSTPKTLGSIRDIVIPETVADLIREKGYIYKGNPGSILNWLTRTEEKLGIEKFTFHKLRHYYCTALHNAGVPDATVMKLGGWSDPGVMQRIYRHGKNDYETMKEAADILTKNVLKPKRKYKKQK